MNPSGTFVNRVWIFAPILTFALTSVIVLIG